MGEELWQGQGRVLIQHQPTVNTIAMVTLFNDYSCPGTLFTKPPLITAPVKTTVKISVKKFGIHEAPATLRIR